MSPTSASASNHARLQPAPPRAGAAQLSLFSLARPPTADAPVDPADRVRLEKIDPHRDMARYYEMEIASTLFGDVVLVREWGRIGRSRQRLEEWHGDAASAGRAFALMQARKQRRGYRRVAAF